MKKDDVTIKTDDVCVHYIKERRTFHIATNVFPLRIALVSHKTGRVINFVQDHALAEKNEWWDGEMMEYQNFENDIRIVCSLSLF